MYKFPVLPGLFFILFKPSITTPEGRGGGGGRSMGRGRGRSRERGKGRGRDIDTYNPLNTCQGFHYSHQQH